jgi:hypothetical protein
MTKLQFIRELVITSSIDPETGSRRLRLRAARELTDNIISNPEKWIKMIQSLAAKEEPQYTAVITTDTCWWEVKGRSTKVDTAIRTAKKILQKHNKGLIYIYLLDNNGKEIYSFRQMKHWFKSENGQL